MIACCHSASENPDFKNMGFRAFAFHISLVNESARRSKAFALAGSMLDAGASWSAV